jgi:AcrR family transcriptional regulator
VTSHDAAAARPSASQASLRRRQAITDAARELLRDTDVEKIAVADIAELAGVSVATVYNLVGPRERVLAAVLDGYIERLQQSLPSPSSPPTDTVAAVTEVFTTAVTHSLADPVPVRALLRELGPLQFSEHQGARIEDVLLPRVREIGDFEPGITPESATRLLVYAFRGLLISWAHGLITDTDFANDAREASDLLLRACRGDTEKDAPA